MREIRGILESNEVVFNHAVVRNACMRDRGNFRKNRLGIYVVKRNVYLLGRDDRPVMNEH